MKQREIKFRAWFSELNEMVYPDGNGYFIPNEWRTTLVMDGLGKPLNLDDLSEPDGIIFDQFTGLKDKNGVDIYEGDICELEVEFQGVHNEFYEQPPFHHILTGIVKYMPSTGYYLSIFKGIDVDTEEDIYHPKRKEIVQYRTKLIGNIHQHKHLLK